MHLTLCPYCTSRREDAQASVEGQSFLFAATSAILDSGNDKELCAMRKETIERVFADAAKKHRKPKFSMLFVMLYHCRFLNPRLKNVMCKLEFFVLF